MKKGYPQWNAIVSFTGIACLTVASGCGSDSESSVASALSSKLSSQGIAAIPSVSSAVGAKSSSSASVQGKASVLQAVSGTVPKFSDISSSTKDQVFWGGAIASIKGQSSPNSSQKETNRANYFGAAVGGPGGEGACRMFTTVAESVGRLVSAGGTACYMKGLTRGPAGTSVTKGSVALSEVFSKGSSTRHVRVNVTGMQGQGSSAMGVNFLISGEAEAPSSYKAQLYFCQGSSIKNTESIEVDFASGLFKSTNNYSEGSHTGSESFEAYLKEDSSGSLVFDREKSRKSSGSGSETGGGKYKHGVEMNGSNEIIAYHRFESSGHSHKTWVKAGIAGSSLSEVQFLQGAFKGESSGSGWSNSFSGATEYQDTSYKSVSSSSSVFSSDLSAADLSGGDFSGALSDASVDFSAYSCDKSPDVEVSMDFSQPEVAALQESCERDRIEETLWSLCDNYSDSALWNNLF